MMSGKATRIPVILPVLVLVLCGDVSSRDLSDCPLPDWPFPFGNVTVESGELYENLTMAEELTIFNFKCFDGYSLFGAPRVQCWEGNWSSELPVCAKIECSNPVAVEHATVVAKQGDFVDSVIGSISEYSCVDGYELVNPNASILVCSLDRQNGKATWEGEKPICEKKLSCDDPGFSPNGERFGDCCLSGDTLRFSCNDSYQLVGNEEIHCLRTGNWSSDRPLCRPLHSEYCEFPASIPNGELKGRKAGDYFVPGEKVEVRCNPGYKCEGNDVVMCEKGGRWAKEFGVCKEVFCKPPTPVAHGKILELQNTNLTKFPYGYGINYVCDKGYRIVRGDSWRKCTNLGVWSETNPKCYLTRCPDPGTPENGQKSGSNYSVGSRIRFKCDSGYELLGSMEILCQANGKWAGELTRCNLPSNYCPDPGTPIMGSRIMSRHEIKMGDKVRFRCNPRTILLGSRVRECLPDGTWSGSPTTCVGEYDFDNKAEVKERLVMTMTEIKDQHSDAVGRSIDLNFPGMTILYFAFDVSSSITKVNFDKSIELAKAIVRKVGVSPGKTRVGAVTFASKAEEIFLPLSYDTMEDVLKALDAIEYTGGGTSASSALSLIRKEYMPVVKRRLNDMKIQSIIFILTDGRTNMGGDPRNEAKLLKAEGVDIYCVGITGKILKKALYDIASRSEQGGEMKQNVFILQDYDTLEWLVQEITYGTANYSMCGLGKENVGGGEGRVVGGQKVTDPWPWMAALNMTEKPNRPEKSVQCGGSIINEYFILTAAHCMYYSDTSTKRKEEDITVKLGVIHIKDVKHLQELEVRKIYVHQDFSQVTLDYDIALLELKTPIKYTAYVRPICLIPKEIPDNSPFYKPQSIVWIAGWGDIVMRQKYEKGIPRKHLKDIALPIQSQETCRESLKDDGKYYYYFSDRMFCAGTGGERNDTCSGDSGGPVMYRQLNKDGYVSWTQIGIVSWGLGCGLEGEYGMYVHLQKLMPWVEKTMEDAIRFGDLKLSLE